jgi:purine-nucleoside phosphorylase
MKRLVENRKTVRKAVSYVKRRIDFNPRYALILGSGLGGLTAKLDIIKVFHFSEIPDFPLSTTEGHAGKMIFGFFSNDHSHSKPLLVYQGRVHYYETGSLESVVFPVILAGKLGVKFLIITNAAGGINSRFRPGDFMLVNDILNLTLLSPISASFGLPAKHSDYFNSTLQKTVVECAYRSGISLQKGTYCWLKGPSYETQAEIRMLRRLGSDAVGMSTVPEIIAANILGIKTVAISLISNMAAGLSSRRLSHSEVTDTAKKMNEPFKRLIENLVLSIK